MKGNATGETLEAPDGDIFNGITPCLVLIESFIRALDDGIHRVAFQGVAWLRNRSDDNVCFGRGRFQPQSLSIQSRRLL